MLIFRNSLSGNGLTDIWSFSLANRSWELVAGGDNQQYVSIGTSCVYLSDFLVFFGGYIIPLVFDID